MAAARGPEWLARVRAGEVLVFDGGYGTMLFAAGLLNGACPELWNDTHADVVAGIHQGYFDAGSDIVETNTFGGTRLKLNEYQIGDRTTELNVKGARLARKAAPAHGYIAGSIGPTSRLPAEYEPLGLAGRQIRESLEAKRWLDQKYHEHVARIEELEAYTAQLEEARRWLDDQYHSLTEQVQHLRRAETSHGP